MTAGRSGRFGPVAWLTGQAILFGAVAGLLGIVANAMFLEAYGSALLPVTYLVIGVAGVAISAALRRGAAHFDLVRLAVAVLGGAAILFSLSWLIAGLPGGVWVSGPLLVLFPILIQLGFVFIGGQAGRILDIAGIKASFPRIMTGFPIGAVLGGVAAVPLVDAFGRIEDLLLVTAAVQVAFVALVWATGRRYAHLLDLPPVAVGGTLDEVARDRDDLSLRGLLGRPFIALLLAYQVLSALGNQLAEFLVFDRASALYPTAEELGRFVAGYTALMNAIAIAFLFLFAGPLLRRFGLRIGIGANPVVGFGFALASAAVLFAAGPAAFGLLAIVSAARIADIALTDGMTRTSINALYQVLPTRQRLVVQATVEGMGVPIAIGVSGVLLLILNALPAALAARIAIFAVVCAVWAWVAVRLYRAYAPALVAALRTRRLLDADATLEASPADVAAVRRLVADPDPRRARLGRELATAIAPDAPTRSADLLEPDDTALPALATALADPDTRDSVATARLLRAMRNPGAARDAILARHVGHRDRALGLLVLERITGAAPPAPALAAALDLVLGDDLAHASRILEAMAELSGAPSLDGDGMVRGALRDELELVRRRVGAGVVARHGRDRLGTPIAQLAQSGGSVALAAEALEVALGREPAGVIVALLSPGLEPHERWVRIKPPVAGQSAPSARDRLVEMTADRGDHWRSSWLRACAIRALRLSGLAGDVLSSKPRRLGGIVEDHCVAEELDLLAPAQSRVVA